MRSATALVAAATLLAAACREPSPDVPSATPERPRTEATASRSPEASLRPYLRLAEEQNRRVGRKRHPGPTEATLGDVSRPVLRRSTRIAIHPCPLDDEPPTAPCHLDLPALPRARWLIVEPIDTAAGSAAAGLAQDHVGGPLPQRQPRVLPATRPEERSPAVVPAYESHGLVARAVLPLERAWVETDGFEIPAGATLRFAIATEPLAHEIDSAPVDFVVRGIPGHLGGRDHAIELFRRGIDPARNAGERGWMEHEVSLVPLEGRMARLRFETFPTDPADPRPQLPLWGDPTVWIEAAPGDRHPFVVLVSLDTLRARSLSAYGREIETSPYFDALAREGTLFTRAFTTYSNTLGSHMSMLTGLWPRTHAVHGRQPLSPRHRTLAEAMRAAGYETAAFTEDGLLRGSAGFSRGFGLYSENHEIGAGAGAAAETFAAGLAWARRHADTPFFLFLHTYQVHAPYGPSGRYATLFDEARERPDQRAYEQEIRYLDDQLRLLVSGLDEALGPARLLLVVTADHGEEFGEHGSSHHSQLYDEVMHVPLLFRWPGTIAGDRRIREAVSLVDVTPTVLDLAGLRTPRGGNGVSLRPVLLGSARPASRVVFGESPGLSAGGIPRRFVGRNDRYKCILDAGESEGVCYDLAADPGEASPLSPDTDPAMRALLDEVAAYRGTSPADESDRSGEREAEPVEIDAKRNEKLRALGYVE